MYTNNLHQQYGAAEWQNGKPQVSIDLWVSEDEVAPIYKYGVSGISLFVEANEIGIRTLCKLSVDAKTLPAKAIVKKIAPRGNSYYDVSYDIAIHFLTTLDFKVMVDGKRLKDISDLPLDLAV